MYQNLQKRMRSSNDDAPKVSVILNQQLEELYKMQMQNLLNINGNQLLFFIFFFFPFFSFFFKDVAYLCQ